MNRTPDSVLASAVIVIGCAVVIVASIAVALLQRYGL